MSNGDRAHWYLDQIPTASLDLVNSLWISAENDYLVAGLLTYSEAAQIISLLSQRRIVLTTQTPIIGGTNMPQVSCSYITATPPGSTTVAPATIVNIAARVVNGDFPSTGAQPISHIFRMYVNGVKIAEKTVRGPNGLAGETEIADFLGASVLVVAHMVISVKVVGTSVETDLRVLVLDYNIQQAAIIPPTTFPPDGAKSSNTPWIIGGVIAGMVALAAILKKK